MTLTWKQESSELWYNNIMIPCSCNVRNEMNGKRSMDEIVYTMPNHKPYMPRIFPKGTWEVGMPEERDTPELAPYFIPTNAFQMLPVWNTQNNSYVSESAELDKDMAYGIHYSEYKNTLGCIKVRNKADLEQLVKVIKSCIKKKEKVYVTVS